MSTLTTRESPESFETFGHLLRYLRVRARRSQRELAIAVGYSEAHISRLEQGQRRPDPVTVRAVIVGALDLGDDPAWAARLVALAEAHGQPSAPASPPPHRPAPDRGLLAVKLYRPRPRAGALPRQHLLRRLDAALSVALTLVAAPAGFGKTTLLATWLTTLAERQRAGAAPRPSLGWLSLDAGDNDLTLFLRYLITALRDAAPGLGRDTISLLDSPAPPPARALLTPLLNDLSALDGEVALVLDDYHLIHNQAIHEAVGLLVEHGPPQLHMVLATRADPPLPLARLRARGQALELRSGDLRFSGEEAETFLQETMGLGVSEAEAASLAARTEGWVTGLQLAALALREQPDRAGFVAAFAGSNRYVLDYLAEEVLDRLPAHLRAFLLQTSILDRLCGELCDAVLGLDEPAGEGAEPRPQARGSFSQHTLNELERLNLFLVPLDGERRWYRYHQLFAEVLRARLRTGTSPQHLAGLYRRASDWLWCGEQYADAIGCAVAAGDYQLAADRIECRSRELLGRGESLSLLELIRALPDGVVRGRPRLALACAWALFHTGQWAQIDRYLAGIEPEEASPEGAGLRAQALALRGCVAAHRNDPEQAIAWCSEALRLLPPDELRVRSAALQSLGTGHYALANVREALRAIHEAAEVGAAGRYLFQTLHALYYASLGPLFLGRPRDIAHTYERARAFVAEMGAPNSPGLGMVLVTVGRVAYEQNDLDAAAAHLAEALARCERLGYPEALADAHLWSARVAAARGDLASAERHTLACERIVAEAEVHPYFVSEYIGSRAAMLFARGDLGGAAALLARRRAELVRPASFHRSPEHLAVARLDVAEGRPAQGAERLEELLGDAVARELEGQQIENLAALAVARHAAGSRERALATLGRVLAMAEPGGYVRTFVDLGPTMAELLREAGTRGIAPAYCARLLAAFA